MEKGSDKEKTYNNRREEVANGNCDKEENSLPEPNAKSKVTIIEILTCF